MSAICGFQWRTHDPCTEGGTSNAHECISEDEHEEYTNFNHFCECGERIDCTHGEISYSEIKRGEGDSILDSDMELPF